MNTTCRTAGLSLILLAALAACDAEPEDEALIEEPGTEVEAIDPGTTPVLTDVAEDTAVVDPDL